MEQAKIGIDSNREDSYLSIFFKDPISDRIVYRKVLRNDGSYRYLADESLYLLLL